MGITPFFEGWLFPPPRKFTCRKKTSATNRRELLLPAICLKPIAFFYNGRFSRRHSNKYVNLTPTSKSKAFCSFDSFLYTGIVYILPKFNLVHLKKVMGFSKFKGISQCRQTTRLSTEKKPQISPLPR